MVKLRRIYSETGLFDEVKFIDGLNIILGKCSHKGRTNDNGIGKSSLVRMIDFGFLSNTGRDIFKELKYDFLRDHTFSLEFFIDNKIYTIKRDFINFEKAFFGESKELIKYKVQELRDILGNKFFPNDEYEGFVDNKWFRNLMRFFIQGDLKNSMRKKPISFVHTNKSDLDMVTYNLYLLNIPNEGNWEYSRKNEEKNNIDKIQTSVKKRLETEHNKSFQEVKTDLSEIKYKINKLENCLKDFKFLENYKDVENDLINLSDKISNKLKEYNALNAKLSNYQKVSDIEIEVDINKIKRLYDEVNKELGNYVKHSLEEIINFRRELSENRKKFIFKRKKACEDLIAKIFKEILELEDKRSRLYYILEEKEAFSSIKNTYERLINEKVIY